MRVDQRHCAQMIENMPRTNQQSGNSNQTTMITYIRKKVERSDINEKWSRE